MKPKPAIRTARQLENPICLPYDTVTAALRQGTIDTEHGLMRFGSNYTFLVSVQHEDVELLAIYKPRIGERPLWDFPDGTLCQREAAAWALADALGWWLVPPTVLREGTRGEGSLQAFIDHDPQRHYFNFEDKHEPQLHYLVVFDAITNNADRKGGHCLLDADDHIWGIDHGLTFNTAHKLRTVIWDYAGEPLPADIVADLEGLCGQLDESQSPAYRALHPLLSRNEIRATQTRVKRLLQAKTYPMPGPGPNRPWPAL
ncbi:MAG: SCO1664 family protein [Anaerolineae bacterium]|jgi:uncharacterized repeat protein (TIGR03843 family)|nr:SCO1664 family protein [Anaerolineae bacterium]